jgi:DNA segregation ATPase FtsK/SpoIIIE, S-DNA-T family
MNTDTTPRLVNEAKGFALGALGLFLGMALFTFNATDRTANTWSSQAGFKNMGGIIGAQVADLLLIGFGLAAYLIPLALLHLAYRFLRFKTVRWKWYKVSAYLGFLIGCATLFGFNFETTSFLGQQVPTGGLFGFGVAGFLKRFLGAPGALLLLLPLLAACIMILAKFSFTLYADWCLTTFQQKWQRHRELAALRKEAEASAPPPGAPAPIKTVPVPMPLPDAIIRKEKKKEKGKDAPIQEAFDFIKSEGNYTTPPLSLLDVPPVTDKKIDKDVLELNARLLVKKLADFGVDGEVVEICPGPVITMYEFFPGPGIKVSRIAGLSDDLSMALQALSIRIVAPIPGKGVVGIEIPNRNRETVFLREIFNCEDFHKHKMKLPMALGKDTAGLPVVTDLARAPHLLVAGATGSGKSVSINTIILSLLYTATPKDVRIIMVDPKMLELSIYEGIPHLLLPVVTNPKKAALALKWAVREMERRYRLMSDKGVRNIDSYNKKIEREEKEAEEHDANRTVTIDEIEEAFDDPAVDEFVEEFTALPEPLEHGHLPYIVVIVDELADLMMVAGRELEEYIARLAQMARAAGIHLILATQRPSVDVITGLIKANFPARLSFQVSSKTDSRTILDCNGAETLLGMGDMLFLPPGTSRLQRLHGAFVSDAEVQRVVDFLKKQGKPVYDKSIMAMKPGDDKVSDDEDEVIDDRYDDAVALVAEAKQASISMVQRRLRIGYNRAARIIEKMEQEGIVGPSDGTSKPREVFINKI